MSQVILPWPSAVLSPNARVHWAAKAKAAKRYRSTCWALAKNLQLRADWDGPIYLSLEFSPPTNRRRDLDNLVASMKSGLDGLADALGVDDSRFHVNPVLNAELRCEVVVRISDVEDVAARWFK